MFLPRLLVKTLITNLVEKLAKNLFHLVLKVDPKHSAVNERYASNPALRHWPLSQLWRDAPVQFWAASLLGRLPFDTKLGRAAERGVALAEVLVCL